MQRRLPVAVLLSASLVLMALPTKAQTNDHFACQPTADGGNICVAWRSDDQGTVAATFTYSALDGSAATATWERTEGYKLRSITHPQSTRRKPTAFGASGADLFEFPDRSLPDAVPDTDACYDCEGCNQCVERQRASCDKVYKAEVEAIAVEWSLETVLCAGLIEAPPILAACVALVLISSIAKDRAAEARRNACFEDAPGKCTDPTTGKACS